MCQMHYITAKTQITTVKAVRFTPEEAAQYHYQYENTICSGWYEDRCFVLMIPKALSNM